jgi:hypothetical protein
MWGGKSIFGHCGERASELGWRWRWRPDSARLYIGVAVFDRSGIGNITRLEREFREKKIREMKEERRKKREKRGKSKLNIC